MGRDERREPPDRDLAIALVGHLLSVVAIAFAAGAVVRDMYWVAGALTTVAGTAFAVAYVHAKRR